MGVDHRTPPEKGRNDRRNRAVATPMILVYLSIPVMLLGVALAVAPLVWAMARDRGRPVTVAAAPAQGAERHAPMTRAA
ncbi:MAG TPA: hypothetical protein VMB72_09825 [Acidimicrobiales bacterium]|nr:hypothetical protein [Acidimicrobiales bacterium]